MAKSNSGKWVSRVGAQGGGKTYRRTRPANYYGILVVIVILGLALTVYSRYERQNPTKTHTTIVQPAIGSSQYAGLAVEACGVTEPYLTPDPTIKGGFVVQATNVLHVAPTTVAEAGDNATLSSFAGEYPGLILSSNELAMPKASGGRNPATTWQNGDTCPTGTKYAGKKGVVTYAYWSSLAQKTPTVTTDPTTIKFTKYMRVTMAFLPSGVTPIAPSTKTVDAMVLAATTTTTTTVPATSTTLGPSVTTSSTTTTTTPTTTTTKG